MSVYIIAEIGNTHEGSLGLAKCFISEAAKCGVDAVKLQTHIFDAESLPDAPNPPYFSDETRKEYFERTAFNLEQYLELKRFSEEECNVEFLSSPFSIEAVDLLEQVDIGAYKIPSGEVSNPLLLKRVAQTGKRILLSSGMSSWQELDDAVDLLKAHGAKDVVVLQCTSIYPCPPDLSGLNLLEEFLERYKLPVGFSDHTLGVAIPILAVAKGASVVEKHFTLSKSLYGSDAKNSTEPDEFKLLVDSLRDAERAMNAKVDKDSQVKELGCMKAVFEKSIVAAIEIQEGSIIEEQHLTVKKPGSGIPAKDVSSILGRVSKRNIPKNIMLSSEDFE